MGTKGKIYTPEQRQAIKIKRYNAMKAKYGLTTDEEVRELYAKWANTSSRNSGKKGGFADKELARRAQKLSAERKRAKGENND